MRKRFPDKFDEVEIEEAPPRQTGNVVAPANRSAKKPRRVQLTSTQVSLAKRLGLTPEQYAAQLMKETSNHQPTPRSNESRDKQERKKSWQRPTMLPDPEPREGVEYRWVRTSIMGDADNKNVSSKFRNGWTPVKAEDHPELHVIPDHDSRFEGNVEVGGLLLCEKLHRIR